MTPQVISEKLFCKSEGERRKQLLTWITELKKSMDILKAKAQKYNSLNTPVGKKNAILALREYKELESQRTLLMEMTKDQWHPLPEVAHQDIIFDKDHAKFEDKK